MGLLILTNVVFLKIWWVVVKKGITMVKALSLQTQ
jgi:hypothetical protein